ncbi:uncharacterized protein BX664DRAFT_344155 [Halteromyces radiatus]|uniref:uncharacterized protein n=1 Tax=Halteromyces radiatus TaxID=101107 RepID=UPI00221F149F|nr:uncharacterized protein BX664DRAFT_344155 [Halteromyces radiatus]KAI8076874.1 hypothetical protein BX664DRAFT_344155 [Halteromyces radiatus]
MPGPATFFTLGAVGVAGAMGYRRRSSQANAEENPTDMSPHAMARRRSSTVQPDAYWDQNRQADYQWRRDYGANFSHNSQKKFPADITQKQNK